MTTDIHGTAARERPILFSGPMVRALLAGTKTQTRRVVKWRGVAPGLNLGFSGLEAHSFDGGAWWALASRRGDSCWEERCEPTRCPYGQPGDRLWVREGIRLVPGQEPDDGLGRADSIYTADDTLTVADAWPWKRSYLPPMHCPRGLSRMNLEITAVRVERLQDISEADAKAEGISEFVGGWWCEYDDAEQIAGATPQEGYRHLWERINGTGSWDANPWVWTVSFRRIDQGASHEA